MKQGIFKNICGGTEWYKDGELHREDGPALEYVNGTKEWYVNGQRHREDGPAVEWYDGIKEWWVNGKCHRLDGPAYEDDINGTKYWYYHDKLIDCDSQEEFERIIRLLAFG